MGKPAQRCFDPSDDYRSFAIGFLQTRSVDDGSTIGAAAVTVTGGICIIMTELAGRSVMGHHGIHGACGNSEKKARSPQCHEWLLGAPIRLGNNADPEVVVFKPAGKQWYAKRGVVDIGITGNKDDIQLAPAPL